VKTVFWLQHVPHESLGPAMLQIGAEVFRRFAALCSEAA